VARGQGAGAAGGGHRTQGAWEFPPGPGQRAQAQSRRLEKTAVSLMAQKGPPVLHDGWKEPPVSLARHQAGEFLPPSGWLKFREPGARGAR
jgi:hypothetical protein